MVELFIPTEGRAWNNFARANLAQIQSITYNDINDRLKEYNGRIVEFKTQTVTFDTEQDKAFFILKWA